MPYSCLMWATFSTIANIEPPQVGEGYGVMARNGKSVALCPFRCLPFGFEPRLLQDFHINIMFLLSQFWDIVSMLWPWARHFTIKCFTWFRWKWVPGRTEIAMCTISSMRRNGCRTVCSPWSWNVKSDDRSSDLISDYKPAPLPLNDACKVHNRKWQIQFFKHCLTLLVTHRLINKTCCWGGGGGLYHDIFSTINCVCFIVRIWRKDITWVIVRDRHWE